MIKLCLQYQLIRRSDGVTRAFCSLKECGWKLIKGLNSYNTKSNRVRIVRTPGGNLRYLHIKKKGTAPKCGDCGIKLPGVRFDKKELPSSGNLLVYLLTPSFYIDSRASAKRICKTVEAEENSTARVWWVTVCQLCEGSGCACFPHRGAEDSQESAEGVEGEEELTESPYWFSNQDDTCFVHR